MPFDHNLEPEEPDQFLPPPPEELPPVPESSPPFATGQDQDAGQAAHQGHDAQPPASIFHAPPERQGSAPRAAEPVAVQYSGFTPAPTPEADRRDMPPQPMELPPVPRVTERAHKRRQALEEEQQDSLAVGDGELMELAAFKDWNTTAEQLADERIRQWEKAVRVMQHQQSMIALQSQVLDDVLGRLLSMERWAQQFTNLFPRGY